MSCALFCFLLFAECARAYDPLNLRYPDIPPPPGSDWVWVGRQMVVDGTPMSIKTFEYDGTEADLVTHFENYWKTLGHGAFKRNKLADKNFLVHETPDFYTTVQYQLIGKHISGSIAISLPKFEKVQLKKLPIKNPPGCKLVNRILSNDLGIYSESVTLLSNKGVRFNVSYYADQLLSSGWAKVGETCNATGCDTQYQSQVGQLQISIKDLPGNNGNLSRILFHLIKQ